MAISTLERKLDTLDGLYDFIDPLNLTPGWVDRVTPIFASKEHSDYLPGHWRYAEARAALEAAGDLIDVKLAERRNLVMRNAAESVDWATTRTLVCAYQMIMPGEMAPSHRHPSNALRIILEGEGAFSVVDGVKMPMNAGDVVLTPGGMFHGHGHEGDQPSYWLDCLDLPLTHLLEGVYIQAHPHGAEQVTHSVEVSAMRFSRDWIALGLDAAVAHPEGLHGPRITLPTDSMPSVGLRAERLETGNTYRRNRSSANRIYSVVSGRGTSRVDGEKVCWERGDTFSVTSGHWVEHQTDEDAMLIEMSDEPLMRFTNHLRFEVE